MAAPWVPTFVYGDAPTTLTLGYSMRPWRYEAPNEGGHRWSASLELATYNVNRQRNLILRLRVMEDERAAFQTMLETLQDASTSTVTITLDTNELYQDPAVEYECVLVHPQSGEDPDAVFQRFDDFIQAFDVEITVRKTDGTAWSLEYIPESSV